MIDHNFCTWKKCYILNTTLESISWKTAIFQSRRAFGLVWGTLVRCGGPVSKRPPFLNLAISLAVVFTQVRFWAPVHFPEGLLYFHCNFKAGGRTPGQQTARNQDLQTLDLKRSPANPQDTHIYYKLQPMDQSANSFDPSYTPAGSKLAHNDIKELLLELKWKSVVRSSQ